MKKIHDQTFSSSELNEIVMIDRELKDKETPAELDNYSHSVIYKLVEGEALRPVVFGYSEAGSDYQYRRTSMLSDFAKEAATRNYVTEFWNWACANPVIAIIIIVTGAIPALWKWYDWITRILFGA